MALAQIYQRVSENARPLRLGRALLTLLVAVVFALAWLVGVTLRALAVVLGWAGEAARLGFRDGRRRGGSG